MANYKYENPKELPRLLPDTEKAAMHENDLCLSNDIDSETRLAPHSVILDKINNNRAFPAVENLNLDIDQLNKRFEEQHALLLSLSSLVHGLIRRNGIDEEQVDSFIHHHCQTKSYIEMCKIASSHSRIIIESALNR